MPLECIYVFRNVIISGNTRGALFPAPNVRDRFPSVATAPVVGGSGGGSGSTNAKGQRWNSRRRDFAFFFPAAPAPPDNRRRER